MTETGPPGPGKRRSEVQATAVCGVLKLEFGRVERDAARLRIRQPAAVLPVADDRAATGGKLYPQLMPPAGERFEFHE